jgi:hypothetical protein
MPRKPRPAVEASPVLPSIPKELIDLFVKGPMTAEAVQAASAAFQEGAHRAGAGCGVGSRSGLSVRR